jgi:hypothetical protein
LPCGRCYSATNLLMERLPLHGGRVWFCHLKCPASCSISCPHTCPQGVEKSRCLGSDPIPQRRRNRNISPGKYGRTHTSGGEYMAGSGKAARGGNVTVGRDEIKGWPPESLATKGYTALGRIGKLAVRPRFRSKSVAGMFRGQRRNFAERGETSRSRSTKADRTANNVELRRPKPSRSICDLPIGDTSP